MDNSIICVDRLIQWSTGIIKMCIRKIITSEHFIEPTCAIKLNRRQCWVGTEDSVELGQKTMLSRDRRRCWVGPSTHNSLCRFEICCLQIYGLKNSSILPIFRRPQCWVRVGFGLSYINNMEWRSEEHTSELQSHSDLVCRLLLEKKKKKKENKKKKKKKKNND